MESRQFKTSWWLWPFTEHIFTVALFALLAPACYAFYLVANRHLALGFSILGAWFVIYLALSAVLDRRRIVRLWVSWPSAIVVLFMCWLIVFDFI
jgi:hypothetical protein